MVAGAAVAGARVSARVRSLSPRASLTWLVGASAAARFLFALDRPTITYLPDEYTYAALARGLAATGRPVVAGTVAHFPALLEPILAAPFWLSGSPGLAFRLTQAESALIMSLGAVPVYLLARRLALGRSLALGCAAVALASPDLLYASYLTADPIAYPLVLGAVYAGVVALDSASRRAQMAFVVLVGLASFARVQYLVLVPALVIASLVVAGGNPRRALQRIGLVVGVAGFVAAIAAAAGPTRVLGIYGAAIHLHASAGATLHRLGTDARLLPFSAGIVLVPGALVALGRGVVRPARSSERAFCALAVLVALGLLGEAALIGASISDSYMERYLICVVPLVAPAFCLTVKRGGAFLATLVVAAALALVAMLVPLSGAAAAGGWTDSTLLAAVSRLEQAEGVGTGAMIISLAAVALAGVAMVVAGRPAARAGLALAVAVGVLASASVAATSWSLADSRSVARTSFPAGRSWVDAARLGTVTLVAPPGVDPSRALELLFWNTSIARAVSLPGAAAIDQFGSPTLDVTPRGRLVVSGSALTGPLLVDAADTWLGFAGERLVRRVGEFFLFRPQGLARLRLELVGLGETGWLAGKGSLTVWPQPRRMRLTMRLALPRGGAATAIDFRRDGTTVEVVHLSPGGSAVASFVVPAGRRLVVDFETTGGYRLPDGTTVAAQASRPSLTPVVSGA